MIQLPWYRRLVTQTMAMQLAIIAFVLLIVSIAFAQTGRDALEEQYGLRVLAVAESVAEIPQIRELVQADVISPEVQEIAEAVRRRNELTFVVITNNRGIRYAHPTETLIGNTVSTPPDRALSGIADWYVQIGTLGRSVRGKVPIWDISGERVVGIVSVGIHVEDFSTAAQGRLAGVGFATGVAFCGGAIAAYLAARRIRRQTLGLEPPEIASLFEQRESMLQSLHEGIFAIDSSGTVTLANTVATRLVGLRPGDKLGDRLDLADLVSLAERPTSQVDVAIQVGHESLLVTSAPYSVRGVRRGVIFTMRDRTDLEGLVSELDTAHSLVEALRAQAHEHSNNLHTISGLIELGQHDDVLSVVRAHATNERDLTELYSHNTNSDPLLVAMLLTKSAIATERDIHLRVHHGLLPRTELAVMRDLVTIIGNLVDNSIDHLSTNRVAGGEIEVGIWEEGGQVLIDVSDSGLGIDPQHLDRIFQAGFTTKGNRGHDGLGLSLVRGLIDRYNGHIFVDSEVGSGTLFSVRLPLKIGSYHEPQTMAGL